MGNYIYGYITPKSTNGMPKSTNGNQTATIHIDVHAVKSIVEDIKSDVTTNEVTTVEANTTEPNTVESNTTEEINEKSIHPYLLEYGTGVSNHIIINNNVYKYEKPN